MLYRGIGTQGKGKSYDIGPEALARGLSYDLPFPSVPISAIEHSEIFLTVLVIYLLL